MWAYRNTSELRHYGKKGMKWGVVKQPQMVNVNKQTKPKNEDEIKTSRVDKLEADYIKKGFAKSDAKIMADNRWKTEKILMAVGATAAVVAVGYVAKKHLDVRVDGMVRKGATLQRMIPGSEFNPKANMYVSTKKYDNLLYSAHLGSNSPNRVKMKVTSKIKIPSRNNVTSIFSDKIQTDSEFRKSVMDSLHEFKDVSSMRTFGRNIEDFVKNPDVIKDKNMLNDIYDAFNISLVNYSDKGLKSSKLFYDTLKEKGYDALLDVNDSKYSNLRTKKPLILFNSEAVMKVDSITKLMEKDVKLLKTMDYMKDEGSDFIKGIAPYVALYGTTFGGLNALGKTTYINEYRKTNPNSGLTDKQILKMLTK